MWLGKISLHGSIALIIGALLIGLIINVGMKGVLIAMIFIAGIFGVLYAFLRLLPEVWALTVIGIGFIGFFHYVVQSWLLSIGLIILLFVQILFHVRRMSRRWKGTIFVLFFTLMSIGEVIHSDYKPEINKQALDEVSEEMMNDQKVENASLETDENEVRCFLSVEDDVLLAERTDIGEMCAKKLSDKVHMKDKRFDKKDVDAGPLYDYYGLNVDVVPVDDGKPLQGTTYNADGLTWHVNRNLPDEESALLGDLQYDDLDGKDLTMTAGYDAYELHLNDKDIHIRFNSTVATVEKEGETTECNYHLSDEDRIVFEGDNKSSYRLDRITEDEVLFLDGDREGTGYIFKVE